jgi:hypothetical protein
MDVGDLVGSNVGASDGACDGDVLGDFVGNLVTQRQNVAAGFGAIFPCGQRLQLI